MNKGKQIEEIFKDISNAPTGGVKEDFTISTLKDRFCDSFIRILAGHIYSAGYRKQSKGEWIIINNRNLEIIRECTNCHAKTYYPIELKFNCRKSRYCEDCGAEMKGGAE